jgi:hypothetical protein
MMFMLLRVLAKDKLLRWTQKQRAVTRPLYVPLSESGSPCAQTYTNTLTYSSAHMRRAQGQLRKMKWYTLDCAEFVENLLTKFFSGTLMVVQVLLDITHNIIAMDLISH